MARRERLTEELQQACWDKVAQGFTTREISKWLLDEHNVKYSFVAVSRLTKRQAATRKEMTEEILRPHLERTLASDLELLERSIAELRMLLEQTKKPADKLKIYDRLDKFLKLSFKVKGITVPGPQDAVAEEREFEQLMKDLRLQGAFNEPDKAN